MVNKFQIPWMGCVCVLFCVLALYIMGSILSSRDDGHKQLEAATQRIVAAGLPASLREFDQSYVVPADPDQNAGEAILAAMADVTAHDAYIAHDVASSSNVLYTWDGRTPLTDQQLTAMRSLIDSLDSELSALRAAAALPKSRYSVDLTGGWSINCPHLGPASQAGRLLRCEALVALDAGDFDRAYQATLGTFDVAYSLRDDPTGWRTRIRVDSLAVRSVRDLEKRFTLGPRQRKALEAIMTRALSARISDCAFSGQAVSVSVFIDNPRKYGWLNNYLHDRGGTLTWSLKRLDFMERYGVYGFFGQKDSDRAYAINCLVDVFEAANERDLSAQNSALDLLENRMKSPPKRYRFSYLYLPILFDNYKRTIERQNEWLEELSEVRVFISKEGLKLNMDERFANRKLSRQDD
jgi:hypothetical protein